MSEHIDISHARIQNVSSGGGGDYRSKYMTF